MQQSPAPIETPQPLLLRLAHLLQRTRLNTRIALALPVLLLLLGIVWTEGVQTRAGWPYAEHAWPRWIVEITALALLALAARQLAVLLRQLDRQQRLYHALAQTADATLRARDRSDLLRQVCTELVTNTPFHAARIGRPDKDGCIQLLAAAGEGAAQLPQDACLQTAQSGNAPLVVRAWMQQQLVYDNDLLANPQSAPWKDLMQRHAWRAVLAVPIQRNGAMWAMLCVVSPQKGVFDAHTVALCRRIGDLLSQGAAAQYVQRKLMALLHQFDRQQRLYHALAQTADALLRSKDEIDLLHQVCTELATNAPFHAVWIGRPDKGGPFHVLAAAGEGSARLPQDIHMQAAQSGKVPLVVQAWLERRLICHNDPLADPRLAHWREIFRGNAWRAMLIAPIVRSGALWALLVVVSSQPNVFDNQTEALYRRIGDLLGQGLTTLDAQRQLAAREQESDHRARHDTLTTLPNRFALELHVPQAIARARRRGQALALGMLDLDDFKPVNDTWGHAAGDVVLQEFARRLRSLLREVDFVGRLGGDEFVVVLADLDPDQAQAQLRIALERLRRAVDEPFALGEHQASIGMSLGLALYPDDGQEMDALLRQADAALYRLKMHKADRQTWWALTTDQQRVASENGK